MNVENNEILLLQIGAKLANFRKKLALSIGQKKITQMAFGEMFGEFTERQIQSYEGGEVEIPVRLFYVLWKEGNSVDGIFREEDIGQAARDKAAMLYRKSISAHIEEMDESTKDRLKQTIGEMTDDDKQRTKKDSNGSAGKREKRPSTSGATKNRDRTDDRKR